MAAAQCPALSNDYRNTQTINHHFFEGDSPCLKTPVAVAPELASLTRKAVVGVAKSGMARKCVALQRCLEAP